MTVGIQFVFLSPTIVVAWSFYASFMTICASTYNRLSLAATFVALKYSPMRPLLCGQQFGYRCKTAGSADCGMIQKSSIQASFSGFLNMTPTLSSGLLAS